MLQHATLNMTRPDLVRLLSDDMSSDRIVKSYEDRVEIDYVVIRFRDDKVNRVVLYPYLVAALRLFGVRGLSHEATQREREAESDDRGDGGDLHGSSA